MRAMCHFDLLYNHSNDASTTAGTRKGTEDESCALAAAERERSSVARAKSEPHSCW